MATIEEPTVKVKVEGDTAAFEDALARLEERAARLGTNPLRLEALHHAVQIETRDGNAGVDDVIVSGKVVGTAVDMHAEQSAQAYLAEHTGL